MIEVKNKYGVHKYNRWQWNLAWFLVWLFGFLFGVLL